MQKRFFVALAALVLTVGAAFAQTNARLLANIPFEFRAGDVSFPAGNYDIRPEVAPGVVLIKCTGCKAAGMIMTGNLRSLNVHEQGTLVFNRYGNKYFLSKIWTAGFDSGRSFRQTKAEQEWARQASRDEVTVAAHKP